MGIRVLIIGPYPRSLNRIDGGVAAATTYLTQALSEDPEIELVGVRLDGRVRLHDDVQDLGWPMDRIDLQRFSVSTLFRRQQRQLASLIKRYRPDVIHAQGADAAGYLAIRSGCPAVVTIHGILSECARLQTSSFRRLRELTQALITERFVVRRATDIVAISPYVARHYKGSISGVIHSIPNAVSPAFFRVRRDPVRGRILFAGRISPGKGVLDLIAAAECEPVAVRELVMAGAPFDDAFNARVAAASSRDRLAGRITLPGLLDEQQLLREFSRAACLVLPSYQETAPMVVQQAMAAGLPVIATRVGGIPDMVEHERSGLLFEPGNVNELRLLIRRISAEERLADRLSSAAKVQAEKAYAAQAVATATKRVYVQLRDGQGGG
jgi:glycosyltransferase involved in cell wall biosynthesis